MGKESLLGTGAKKVLKGFHISFVTFASGGLLSMIVIMLLKRLINLDESIAILDLVIYKIFNYAVNYGFFALITTSVIYALFTQWGFFRHYWITVKWVVIAGIFLITWFWLGPSINGMASLSDAGFHTAVYRTEYLRFVNRSLLFTTIELTGVIFVFFISTIKPWRALQHASRLNRKVLLSVVLGIIVIVIGLSVPASLSQRKCRRMSITDSNLSIISDGSYIGEAEVGGFVYKWGVLTTD